MQQHKFMHHSLIGARSELADEKPDISDTLVASTNVQVTHERLIEDSRV